MTGKRVAEVYKLLPALLLSLLVITGCGSSAPETTTEKAPDLGDQAVAVVDYATGVVTGLEPLKVLAVEAGPKSVELMPGGDRIFVNDLYAHKNFIFDAATYEVLKIIPLPDEPVETDFSPDGRFAWVSLYNSSKVVVVDTEAGTVTAQAQTGSIPK